MIPRCACCHERPALKDVDQFGEDRLGLSCSRCGAVLRLDGRRVKLVAAVWAIGAAVFIAVTYYFLPFWVVAIGFSAWTLAAAIAHYGFTGLSMVKEGTPHRYCRKCGYDLSEGPEGQATTCPECGKKTGKPAQD